VRGFTKAFEHVPVIIAMHLVEHRMIEYLQGLEKQLHGNACLLDHIMQNGVALFFRHPDHPSDLF
jgi:hypothetical protein